MSYRHAMCTEECSRIDLSNNDSQLYRCDACSEGKSLKPKSDVPCQQKTAASRGPMSVIASNMASTKAAILL